MEPVSLVLAGQAISSLRESDFDTCSAIGEVIDNSLQANATEIHLLVQEKELPPQGRRPAGTKVITSIAFGDNGHGMDAETLHRCMQLGFSTRYNDRTGIGRFGVGMTLGAINQCLKIDVYSKKEADKKWRHTGVALENVVDDAYIPAPKHAEIPAEYRALVGQKQGTLVLWSKFDRQAQQLSDIEHWIARTYRRFIGERVILNGKVVKNESPILITINGSKVTAFDPLYAVHSADFPSDETAQLFDPIPLDMPVPSGTPGKQRISRVMIQLSLTPESWRMKGGGDAGRSAIAQRLRIDENEGFSILRAGREVFYDVMPHFEPKPHSDGIDRWWSAEISFEPALDIYFSVRNIKRGARFIRELREKIQEQMKPTISECRDQIKERFAKSKQEDLAKNKDVNTEHASAEKTVKDANPTPGKAGKNKTPDQKKQEIHDILAPIVGDASMLEAWRAKIESQPCTIVDNPGSRWKGSTFLDLHFQGGKTIIEYNMAHDFFMFVYGEVDRLVKESESEGVESIVASAKELKAAIDLLFMAYAQAESMADRDHEQKQGDTLDMLRSNWGTFLQQFVRTRAKTQ